MATMEQLISKYMFPFRKGGPTGNDNSKFSTDYQNNLSEFNNSPTAAASVEASMIYVCPPVYNPLLINAAEFKRLCMPLGAIQNFNLSAARQEITVKELGSRLPRKVSGAPQYGVTLSRMLTIYSNLPAALYQWLKYVDGVATGGIDLNSAPASANRPDFWIGFESEIFGLPFGLLDVKVSAGGKVIGVSLIEFCGLLNSGTSENAGSILIMDNASISVGRVKPLVDAQNVEILYNGAEANPRTLTNFKFPIAA